MAIDRVNHHASLRRVLDDYDGLCAEVGRMRKSEERTRGQYSVLQGQQQQLKDTNVTLRTELANEREKTARLESRCDEQTDVMRGLRAALKDAVLAASDAVPEESDSSCERTVDDVKGETRMESAE